MSVDVFCSLLGVSRSLLLLIGSLLLLIGSIFWPLLIFKRRESVRWSWVLREAAVSVGLFCSLLGLF